MIVPPVGAFVLSAMLPVLVRGPRGGGSAYVEPEAVARLTGWRREYYERTGKIPKPAPEGYGGAFDETPRDKP